MSEIGFLSNSLPDGVDGVMVLANMANNAKYLASVNIYKNQLDAWWSIEDTFLHVDDAVVGYSYLNVVSSGIDNCYNIHRKKIDGKFDKLLCVNGSISTDNHIDILYKGYSPFFVLIIPSGTDSISNIYSRENIIHYRDFRDAENAYNN